MALTQNDFNKILNNIRFHENYSTFNIVHVKDNKNW